MEVNIKGKVLEVIYEGNEYTITPTLFNQLPEVRRLIFSLAREGEANIVKWLWDNYHLKEATYEEIKEYNLKKEEMKQNA